MSVMIPDLGFQEHTKALKTSATIAVVRDVMQNAPRRILVVGCGSGMEAGMLAREFSAEVIGIDVQNNFEFAHAESAPATLLNMDARNLAFESNSFDLVYSYHALEHIPQPNRALAEAARVLKPNGTFLIGTPNRSRLVGYIGAPHAFWQKVWFNIEDFGMRVRGRWNNEAGAHAGFSSYELISMCRESFGVAQDVSEQYYCRLYARRKLLVQSLVRWRLHELLFPCVYVAGTRTE